MENILCGPELSVPVPFISLGVRLFEEMRQLEPTRLVFIDGATDETITYKEFLDLSCRLARSLQNCGYKLNDIMTICTENSCVCYVPMVASLFLGMVSALLCPSYSSGEMLHMLKIIQPKLVFCSVKALASLVEQKEKVKCIERIIVLEDEIVNGHDNLRTFIEKYCEKDFCVDKFEPVGVDPVEQVAAIVTSSGTTGMPKGVMVTHDNLAMRASQTNDPRWWLPKHEIILSVVPNFHMYGLMSNIGSMLKGNTTVTMKRFDEKLFLESIEKYKVNLVLMVPTIVRILAESNILQNYDVRSVEEVACGSAPLSEGVEESFTKKFPNLKFFRQLYSMTEVTIPVLLTPTGQAKTGSAGKVGPGCSLKFRDLKTGRALGPNQRGEICIKGRMVTKGYYRNPEATRDTFVNGWVHSGDLGYYDEDGFVFVVDRIKELIKYKGFQVPPTEIECVLMNHPKIKAVSVVAKPDELAGELPTAFVVKEPGNDVTEDEIKKFVADRLSKTKHLHGGVYFVDDLPKTASGKVMRRALRDAFFVKGAEKL